MSLPTSDNSTSVPRCKGVASFDQIRVVVRCKPNTDTVPSQPPAVRTTRESIFIQRLPKRPARQFCFDYVASERDSQEDIFINACIPIVDCVMAGFHGTIFAYGQSGTGKTYTMMGDVRDIEYKEEIKFAEEPGIIQRACEEIFKRINEPSECGKHCKVRASFLEIYNEKLRDLLRENPSCGAENDNFGRLYLRESRSGEICVEGGRIWKPVKNVNDCVEVLLAGISSRSVGATAKNQKSSRSHAIFTLDISHIFGDISQERKSHLHFVDLAGSERQQLSLAEGSRLKESSDINKSLSTLGMVIQGLAGQRNVQSGLSHIPYRDSKLTFFLKEALGGNSKTCFIATISIQSSSLQDIVSTLEFAHRCGTVQNKPVVNEKLSSNVENLHYKIQQLQNMVENLKEISYCSRCNASLPESDNLLELPESKTISSCQGKQGSKFSKCMLSGVNIEVLQKSDKKVTSRIAVSPQVVQTLVGQCTECFEVRRRDTNDKNSASRSLLDIEVPGKADLAHRANKAPSFSAKREYSKHPINGSGSLTNVNSLKRDMNFDVQLSDSINTLHSPEEIRDPTPDIYFAKDMSNNCATACPGYCLAMLYSFISASPKTTFQASVHDRKIDPAYDAYFQRESITDKENFCKGGSISSAPVGMKLKNQPNDDFVMDSIHIANTKHANIRGHCGYAFDLMMSENSEQSENSCPPHCKRLISLLDCLRPCIESLNGALSDKAEALV